MTRRILIVDGHRKAAFYEALISTVQADWISVSPPELWSPVTADLVIVDDESWPHCGAALPELHRARLPTLHLIDGIVEWRNQWENPDSVAARHGRRFDPILSDKLACLGRAQARLLESWGNPGKCEVTGSPRFDALIGRRPRVRPPNGAWRVLIATARKPGFTDDQRARIRHSLVDLKQWFADHRIIDGVRLEPVWRLTAGLDHEIGVDGAPGNATLSDQLAAVDALITTPSTVLLEGMLCGVPVALLDYLNRPPYVPAAWSITASSHLDEIIRGLMTPPPERMRYQDAILHDHLECRTPATGRVAAVIDGLVEAGRTARAAGHPLKIPRRMLPRDPLDDTPGPADASQEAAVLRAEVERLRSVIRDTPGHAVYRLAARWQRLAEERLRRPWRSRG